MTYVHIHAPKCAYALMWRRYGHRRWTKIGDDAEAMHLLMPRMGNHMADRNPNGSGDRYVVLACTDWYEPIKVFEAKR